MKPNNPNLKLGIISLVLVVVVAGYINYEYNPEREENLGKTMYVNSNIDEVIDVYESSVFDSTYTYTKEEDTISVFRLDRENMFSEIIDNYREIISNQSTSNETLEEYQKKLDELINKKNSILMIENIIKSNGVEDVVIIPTNDDNYNVILKTKENLSEEVIENIRSIIISEFDIDESKLNVTIQ